MQSLVPESFPKKFVDDTAVTEMMKKGKTTLAVNNVKKFIDVIADRHEKGVGANYVGSERDPVMPIKH
mgnify:CR=1 FL=1